MHPAAQGPAADLPRPEGWTEAGTMFNDTVNEWRMWVALGDFPASVGDDSRVGA